MGYLTDTYDIEGKIFDKKQSYFKRRLAGKYFKIYRKYQTNSPMYSAIKVQGKIIWACKKGIEIERKERDIKYSLNFLISLIKPIRAKVSKGCYIRSLIFDIASELETYGTMTELRREQVGKAKIENAFTIEKIEEMVKDKDFFFFNICWR